MLSKFTLTHRLNLNCSMLPRPGLEKPSGNPTIFQNNNDNVRRLFSLFFIINCYIYNSIICTSTLITLCINVFHVINGNITEIKPIKRATKDSITDSVKISFIYIYIVKTKHEIQVPRIVCICYGQRGSVVRLLNYILMIIIDVFCMYK